MTARTRRAVAGAAGVVLVLGGAPASAAAHPHYRGWVALAGAGWVSEIDVATGTVLPDAVKARDVRSVAVTPDGSTAYVTESARNTVDAVDVRTGKTTSIAVGPYPQDLVLSPDGDTGYVAVTGSDSGPGGVGTLAVIDTAAKKVVGRIEVGNAPRRVAVSPDGSRAWVTTASSIAVIDTAAMRVAGVVADHEPTGPQGIAVSRDGKQVYVTNPGGADLWVLDATTDRVLHRIPTGGEGPYAVTTVPHRRDVFVADTNSDSVTEIDPATGRIVATIPVGRLPVSIGATPDGSQVWAGNGLSSTISVIDPETGAVRRTIELAPGTTAAGYETLDIAFSATPAVG